MIDQSEEWSRVKALITNLISGGFIVPGSQNTIW